MQMAGCRSRVVPIFQLVLCLSSQACALLAEASCRLQDLRNGNGNSEASVALPGLNGVGGA